MAPKVMIATVTGLIALGLTTVGAVSAQADAGPGYHQAAIIRNNSGNRSVGIVQRGDSGSFRCFGIENDAIGGTRRTNYIIRNYRTYDFWFYFGTGCRQSQINDYYSNYINSDRNKYWYIFA